MPRTLVPEWEMRDRLRKALDVSGVGVSEMADELGVSRNAVGNWLAGRTKPSRSTVLMWAAITGVDAGWLLTGRSDQDDQLSGWTSDEPYSHPAVIIDLTDDARGAVVYETAA